jgi:hypothetical protein
MIKIDRTEKATQKTPNYTEKQGNSGCDGRVFASYAAIAPAERGDCVPGAGFLPGVNTPCKILTNSDLGHSSRPVYMGASMNWGQETPHASPGG